MIRRWTEKAREDMAQDKEQGGGPSRTGGIAEWARVMMLLQGGNGGSCRTDSPGEGISPSLARLTGKDVRWARQDRRETARRVTFGVFGLHLEIAAGRIAADSSSPREFGKGSRQCRVCAHQAGLIR